MQKLIIKVKEIKGNCAVYKKGDCIVLDEGYRMNLQETDNVCMHSLSSKRYTDVSFKTSR